MTGLPRGVFKRGDTYYITWEDLKGNRHKEAIGPTLQAAVRAREKRLVDRRDEKFNLKVQKRPTLREFVDQHWRREVAPGLKPSTRASYEGLLTYHLLKDFGQHRLDDINRSEIRAFIQRRVETHKAQTIRNAVALLSAILALATVDHELLPTNPIAGMTRPKYYPSQHEKLATVHFLEPAAFMAAVAELGGPARNTVLVLALTGLRWGELQAITPDDVDLRVDKLHVSKSIWGGRVQTPKSANSVRAVEMTPAVREILSDLGQWRVPPHNTLTKAWYRAQEAARVCGGGSQCIRVHDLRHQYAVLNIMAGKHPKWLQRQMGHGDIRVTMDRYGGLMETIPVKSVTWIDDLLPGLEATVFFGKSRNWDLGGTLQGPTTASHDSSPQSDASDASS